MSSPQENKKYRKNLVLSGGGVKGIVHVGALYALQKLNILDKFEVFGCSSIGAIMGALYVIGFSPAELYDFIKLLDFPKLKNMDVSYISEFGLDNGAKLDYVLKRLIKTKCDNENITLKEVYEKFNKKLIFSAVCINDMEICYLSHETFPDLQLWIAIRMSSAFPFYFCPILYNGKYYIDGGIWDNYPMDCFMSDQDISTSTLGLFIIGGKTTVTEIPDAETYLLQVCRCLMYAYSLQSRKGYEKYTINIHVENVHILEFDITNETKDTLFIIGYQSVLEQINKIN